MTNILRKDKRANLSAIFFLSITTTLFFSSCKKEETDLGLDVQPTEDLLNALYVDTFTVHTHSVKEDSLRTDELSSVMIGNYSHPDFGVLNASFYTQLGLTSTTLTVTGSPTIDSVVLQMPFAGSYGTAMEQTFEVYEVTDPIHRDSVFYSNTVKAYNPTNLASSPANTYTPSTSDTMVIGTTKIKPHLRLRLDQQLGQDLITHVINGIGNNDALRTVFMGLYVKSSTVPSGTQGATYNVTLTDAQSRLIVYYHDNTDTTEYNFTLGDGARFTHFSYDRTGSQAEAQLNDSTLGDTYYYLQGGASLGASIYIPHIAQLGANQNVVVNKAELVLPVQFFTVDPYSPPPRIFVFPYTADGKYEVTTDQLTDPTLNTYGGLYQDSKKAYVFNISRHIQSVVKGDKINYGFRLAISGSSVFVNRVTLNGPDSPNRGKPYLKITYTKYQ